MSSHREHYICGDTHDRVDLPKIQNWASNKSEKILFQLGDFGGLFYEKDNKKLWLKDNKLLRDWLKLGKQHNFTLFVVPGNHENWDMIDKLPTKGMFGGIVQYIDVIHPYKNNKTQGRIYFLMRGEVYLIDGIKYFVMGGANTHKSFAGETDRDGEQICWSREIPSFGEYKNAMINFKRHDYNVDVILSHTTNANIGYQTMVAKYGNGAYSQSIDFDKVDDPLTRFFTSLSKHKKVRYKSWYFGHFHHDCIIRDLEDDRHYECHYNKSPKLINI
jgi:DNA repair exonuclease SbcCD nuclease subunit